MPLQTNARLTRSAAYASLTVDLLLGLAWLLQSPARTLSIRQYEPARDVFGWLPVYPMRVWGLILLVLVTMTALAIGSRNRKLVGAGFIALVGFWSFWAIMLALAIGSGTFSGPLFALARVVAPAIFIRSPLLLEDGHARGAQ